MVEACKGRFGPLWLPVQTDPPFLVVVSSLASFSLSLFLSASPSSPPFPHSIPLSCVSSLFRMCVYICVLCPLSYFSDSLLYVSFRFSDRPLSAMRRCTPRLFICRFKSAVGEGKARTSTRKPTAQKQVLIFRMRPLLNKLQWGCASKDRDTDPSHEEY